LQQLNKPDLANYHRHTRCRGNENGGLSGPPPPPMVY
jgi:hypothetical protein